ncbi:unnamed protein product [Adineta steineri]|uniref:Amine oxidase domain-containing protein n=1 Tax=Adineta steineri TaxID=433720 RepID=A0A819RRH0_9BILA|nr:unnamed protein product [Adineta steineri]CAF4042323.1 unnamed protein product [Adineta steineri]
MTMDFDVVIVGAGAAGIAAAIELQKTNLSFIVLEARNYIGGRAFTDRETFISTPVDLGASWIHSFGSRNPLYDYYQRLGKDDQFDYDDEDGDALIIDYNGRPLLPHARQRAKLVLSRLYDRLDEFAVNNRNSDDQNIEQVIQTVYEQLIESDEQVKRIVDLSLSGMEQYEGSNLNNLSAKCWETGGAPGGDRWVSCGYGTLLQRICKEHNIPIRLNTLVTHIDTSDTTRIATTTSDSSSALLCHRVIITIPLGCLKRNTIIFEPPLPEWKREAIDRMGYGLMNKLVVQFPDCFWGSSTRTIIHACTVRRGRFRFTICLPPPSNILIFFVTGTFAKELEILTDNEILVEIITFLQNIFPKRTIPNPIRYKFSRWSQDPLAYGSYSNFAVHSNPQTIADLAKETADGRVHWAGEHANSNDGSEDWCYACVHTAFTSGQRAAKAIQKQLNNS